MPFTAHCPFCPAKLSNVPDKRLGATVRCPKCGSDFRAAPREEPASVSAAVKTSATARTVAATPETAAEKKDDLWTRILDAPGQAKSGAISATFSAALFAVTSMPRWVNVWGLAGFLAGSMGLLFASLDALRFMTIPLAGAGVLVVLFGVVKRLGRFKKRDLIWLPLGGVLAGIVLLAALFQPGLLNARWGMDFTVADPDLNKLLLVTRDNKNVVKEMEETDWADAPDQAIRQEDFLIRVESAALGEPSAKETGGALTITLHLTNLSPMRRIVYTGQRKRQEPATLRDSGGQPLKPLMAAGTNKRMGPQGLVSLMPLQETKEVLVFEWPAAQVAYVDLELPASAWGRHGTCRFRIRRPGIHGLTAATGGEP